MKLEGWEDLLLDEDVVGLIRAAVKRSSPDLNKRDDAALDIELADLAAASITDS